MWINLSVTIEYDDSDLESEDLENPFLHEKGCPLAWKPPEIKTPWNNEVFKSKSPLEFLMNGLIEENEEATIKIY